jgi:drug/metabolite transporter (DMT)-like permease
MTQIARPPSPAAAPQAPAPPRSAPTPPPLPYAQPPGRTLGIILILLTLLGWSSIPLFLRHFTQPPHRIDAWTANGWRYAFSALLWAPVLITAAVRRSTPRGLWRAALVPGLFNAVAQAAFAAAPYYIDPGLMTFSLRLQIVFLTIGAALLFPAERRIIRSPGFLIGIAAVFGGAVAMILLNPNGLGHATGIGVILAIGSGLLYACYSLSVRHYMHGVPPFTAFAAISQYTAVLLLVPMFLFGEHHGTGALSLSTPQFLLLLLSSLIGIGLGHTFYYISIARLGLAVSAGVVQLQPFLVAATSFFLFDERLTPLQWLSGLIAIAGAALILYVQHRVAQAQLTESSELKDLPIDAVTALGSTESERARTAPVRR